MENIKTIKPNRLFIVFAMLFVALHISAHKDSLSVSDTCVVADSVRNVEKLAQKSPVDSIALAKQMEKSEREARKDSIRLARELKRANWSPNPKKALWLALVLPGAGQIYNRKYWKLPIIYGGFVGCVYAMTWNDMMYHDYSQAYVDIMDNDPNTQSYNQFLHLGSNITEANAERYKNLFKKRKDYYRRYRDLSFFCLIGVYALSVIDAYVDASLSQFDISKDLSLRVSPAVIRENKKNGAIHSSSLGVQCSLCF